MITYIEIYWFLWVDDVDVLFWTIQIEIHRQVVRHARYVLK